MSGAFLASKLPPPPDGTASLKPQSAPALVPPPLGAGIDDECSYLLRALAQDIEGVRALINS